MNADRVDASSASVRLLKPRGWLLNNEPLVVIEPFSDCIAKWCGDRVNLDELKYSGVDVDFGAGAYDR